MNIRIKKFFVFFLFCLCGTLSNAQTRDELKSALVEFNAQMPISLGPSGEIQSMHLEGQNVVLEMLINDLGNVITKNQYAQQEYKEDCLTTLSGIRMMDPAACTSFQLFAKLGLGLKMNVTSENTNDRISVIVSPEELSKCMNSDPDFEKILRLQVKNTCKALPISSNGMTITNCELRGRFHVTTSVIDESQLDMDLIEQSKLQFKNLILENITKNVDLTVVMNAFLCYKGNYGIIYEYVGSKSNKKFQVILSNEELGAIFNTAESIK